MCCVSANCHYSGHIFCLRNHSWPYDSDYLNMHTAFQGRELYLYQSNETMAHVGSPADVPDDFGAKGNLPNCQEIALPTFNTGKMNNWHMAFSNIMYFCMFFLK